MKQMKFYKGTKHHCFQESGVGSFTNNKTRAHESNEIQMSMSTAQKTRAHESSEIQTPSA